MIYATSTYIALALAAAAAGTSYYNTTKTAHNADQVAAQGIREQSANQKKANARINKTLDEEANSSLAGSAKQAQDQYLAQAQRSMAQANAGLTERGLSSDFDERAGGAAASNADWSALGAKLLGTIDGASRQRDAEAKNFGNTGMDLSVIGSKIGSDDFLNKLRLSQVRRNAGLDLAAGLMNGAAGGVASGAGSAGAATAADYGTYNPAWGT